MDSSCYGSCDSCQWWKRYKADKQYPEMRSTTPEPLMTLPLKTGKCYMIRNTTGNPYSSRGEGIRLEQEAHPSDPSYFIITPKSFFCAYYLPNDFPVKIAWVLGQQDWIPYLDGITNKQY